MFLIFSNIYQSIKIDNNSNLISLGKWLPIEGEFEESWKVCYCWGEAMKRKHVFLDVIEKEVVNLYLSA